MTQEKPEKFNQKGMPENTPEHIQEIEPENVETTGAVESGSDWENMSLWQMRAGTDEERNAYRNAVGEVSSKEAAELGDKYDLASEEIEKISECLSLLRHLKTFGTGSSNAVEFLFREGVGENDEKLKELLKEDVVANAFKEGFLNLINDYRRPILWSEIAEIKRFLGISSEVFEDSEFLNTLVAVIKELPDSLNLRIFKDLKDYMDLSDDFFERPDIQTLLKEGLIQEILSGGGIEMAAGYFGFSEEDILEASRRAIIEKVNSYKGRRMIEAGAGKLAAFSGGEKGNMILGLSFPGEVADKLLEDPEVMGAARKMLVSNLTEGDVKSAANIVEQFEFGEEILEEEDVVEAAEDGIGSAAREEPRYLYLYNNIPMSKDVFKEQVEGAIKISFANGAPKKVEEILEGLGGHLMPEKTADLLKKHFDLEKIDEEFAERSKEQEYFQSMFYVDVLSSELFAATFPKMYEYAKERILGELSEDEDLADYVIERLDNYISASWIEEEDLKNALSHPSVAAKYYWKYKNSEDVMGGTEALSVDKGILNYAQKVMEKAGLSTNLEDRGKKGISETDPYKEHKWLFTSEQAHMARVVEQLMKGEEAGAEELQELGLKTELRRGNLFEQLGEHIYERYMEFVREVEENKELSEEDKASIAFPDSVDVPLKPLIDNLRAFVARYVVQNYSDDEEGFKVEIETAFPEAFINDVDPVLREALRRYIKVLETDVPLYDKLYEEFDNWRESGRYPMEVYLGRDGIYAYLGRRAQNIARRKKLGPEGRRSAEEERGEILDIDPHYLVYPRYFRDVMAYTAKKKFLEQERISIEHDPMFYDTGYTGSIPEQIMRVMDFPREEIENRIRLLSATKTQRRVRGVDDNARSEIVNYIEGNAKTEESAEGLAYDNKTGEIHHIAEPTSPAEQFYFNVVKQAIERHYWVKEYKNYEASGNINIDSETHKLRLRQDYMPVIPEGLTEKPREFIEQNGEPLKEARGGSEGGSRSLKLDDGTEIIAKRVSPERADEERKEYAVLISAQNTNLPGAEPVGYIEAKNDDGADYVLMTKVNGLSGENIKEHLENLEDLSEEDISGIMDEIVEKNKELAEEYREILRVDKRWQIKDTIIQLDENSGEVKAVIPIDWEEAGNYDPKFPGEVDTIA